MKLLKLTGLPVVLFLLAFVVNSCKKEEDRKRTEEYVNDNIIMTPAKSVPANASTGTALLSAYYNKRTRILLFRVTWSGLSSNVSSIGIYGPAPAGYMAISPAGGPAGPLFTATVTGSGTAGTYSNTIYIDEAVFKDQTLLNGLYYVRVNTATYGTFGEVRGQLVF